MAGERRVSQTAAAHSERQAVKHERAGRPPRTRPQGPPHCRLQGDVTAGLLYEQLTLDLRETNAPVQTGPTLVAEEEDKRRPQGLGLGHGGLDDLSGQAAAPQLGADDHAPEAHNRKPRFASLDLGNHQASRSDQGSVTRQ